MIDFQSLHEKHWVLCISFTENGHFLQDRPLPFIKENPLSRTDLPKFGQVLVYSYAHYKLKKSPSCLGDETRDS